MKLSEEIRDDLLNLLKLESDGFVYIDDYLPKIEQLEKDKEELVKALIGGIIFGVINAGGLIALICL